MPPQPPTPPTPNNIEIDNALKAFENTEGKEHTIPGVITPQATNINNNVEGVNFDTSSYGAVKYYKETVTPKMVKAVIKYSGGAIKSQKQAEYILLAFVIFAIGISLFLVFGRGNTKPSPQALEQMKQHMPVFNSN